MGDIYNYETNNINHTFSSSDPHHDRSSHDISFLFCSRPSTMFSSYPHSVQPFSMPAPCGDPRRSGGILGVDSSDHGVLSAGYWPGNVRGASENETDHDRDCESEEGLEALIDEISAKAAPPRSSKRGRAAEVHNLSEKRRRRRINEKMKALQNLIPNSNKTDKASMLDEAIGYLKQLQLQVQMLSMRNGISLFPRCLPGGLVQPLQLSQVRMGFGEETGSSQHRNMTSSVHLDEEARLQQTSFGLPDQCTSSNQLPSIPDASNIVCSKTSFGFESSIQDHFGPFPLCTSSDQEICRKGLVPPQQLNVNHAERNPSEFQLAAVDTTSLPFAIQACHSKDDSVSLQACMIGRDQTEGEECS